MSLQPQSAKTKCKEQTQKERHQNVEQQALHTEGFVPFLTDGFHQPM